VPRDSNESSLGEQIEDLRHRLAEAEQTIEAIRTGQADAIVVQTAEGVEIFTLQGADAAYRVMVENMNEGAMTVDHQGVILYSNSRMNAMVPGRRAGLTGESIYDFLPKTCRASMLELLGAAFAGEKRHGDFLLVVEPGRVLPVYVSGALVKVLDKTDVCLVISDLTERRLAEEKLTRLAEELEFKVTERTHLLEKRTVELEAAIRNSRLSEQRFQQLADAMPQLVWSAQPDGVVDYVNRRHQEFAELLVQVGRQWDWPALVHPVDLHATVEAWRHSLDDGTILQVEHRLKHVDGSFNWYLSRSVPARTMTGKIVRWYGTATNIDEIKETQAQLVESRVELRKMADSLEEQVAHRTSQVRALARALTLAEQKERQRLSHILHEELQQILFAAKARFDLLGDELAGCSEGARAEAAEVQRLTAKALDTTKMLAVEFNPPILKSEGLDEALRWLAYHMEQSYGVKVEVHIPEGLRVIPEEERTLVVQLVRELLYNVAKHAGARSALVSVRHAADRLSISVEDRGTGFDVASWKASGGGEHLGLFSIQDRVHLFGGHFDVESAPGKGTRITIGLPFDTRDDKLGVD
jgi:PAS domain S-box-containing protein